MPEKFVIDDSMVLPPAPEGAEVEVVRGPNIKPFPINQALADKVSGKALIKVGDNITTDHIMPSNAKLLPFRSNVPYLAEFCLTPCDPDFRRGQRKTAADLSSAVQTTDRVQAVNMLHWLHFSSE